MNLKDLYSLQGQLDSKIKAQHHLQNENLVERKILALLVELGELANETRCFKFWSTKASSPKEIILEEYVDGLHFILSLGLDLGMEVGVLEMNAGRAPLVNQFSQLYSRITSFRTAQTTDEYQDLFRAYLELGASLGFAEDEIISAYFQKNETNHERQKQGY